MLHSGSNQQSRCFPAVHTLQAYVEQNDNFYSMLTVAETLTMSSQLQLSPGMSADDKATYVDNLISVLGLAKVRSGAAIRLNYKILHGSTLCSKCYAMLRWMLRDTSRMHERAFLTILLLRCVVLLYSRVTRVLEMRRRAGCQVVRRNALQLVVS